MTPLKVKQKLQEALTVIQGLHWNSRGFEHMYLGELYSSLLESTDKFIEVYSGKYGREKFYGAITIDADTSISWKLYLTGFMVFLNSDIKTILNDEDSDLDNIIAEMKESVNHLFYFLG